jgi:uncharacterized protein (TIGR03067 family)
MRRRSFLLAASLSLAFAPAPLPKPDTGKDDLRKMQGEWVRVRYTLAGRAVGVDNSTITIANNHLRYGSTPGVDEWILTLEYRKKPQVFDIRSLARGSRKVFRGIYRLEGDTLTVLSRDSPAEGGRPTDFDASRPGVYAEVFHRKKR